MSDAGEQDLEDLVQTNEQDDRQDLLDDAEEAPPQDGLEGGDQDDDLVPTDELEHLEDLVPAQDAQQEPGDRQYGAAEAGEQHDADLAGLGLGLDDADAGGNEAGPSGQQRHGYGAPGADAADMFADGGEEEPGMAHHSEAEEELPEPVKKKEGDERREMLEQIGLLIAKMEQAVEYDQADVLTGKPGLRKLKMLREIDAAVARVKMHALLLKTGFFGLLKAFLEPLRTAKKRVGPDGRIIEVLTLPHHKVRETVYRALQRLPVDTHDQEARDMIKNSAIGPVLRFYAKVRQETPANRRLVSDILNGWMLPIVEEGRKSVRDAEAEHVKREEAVRDLKRRRLAERAREEHEVKRMTVAQDGMKVGDAGYRYHARVPRANFGDYVKAPAIPEHVRRQDQEKVEKEKGARAKIKKATLALQRANKVGQLRSTKVELSGKNVGNDII